MVSLGILMTMCFDIMLKYIQTDITLFCHHYLVGFLRYWFFLTSLIRKISVQVASAKKESFANVKHDCAAYITAAQTCTGQISQNVTD